jgi:hypothetical protein
VTASGFRELADRLDGFEVVQAKQRADIAQADSTLQDHADRLAEIEEKVGSLAKKEQAGRPVDWLTIRDPKAAAEILTALVDWHTQLSPNLHVAIPYDCWPWHPLAVIETLALWDHHRYAYKGPAPSVSDFLSRIVPGYRTRLKDRLLTRGECTKEVHTSGGASYSFDPSMLAPYAEWWATSREGTPPGLTLTPQD